MNHRQIFKEQMLHLLFGTTIFVALACFAVGLDLAAGFVASLGASKFTSQLLGITAHGMLVLDLVLFLVYLVTSSIELVKEMIK